jgi:ornithine cyclodeaminase
VDAFAADIGARAVSTYAEAIEAADIIWGCTHAAEPVVRRDWLRPGVHVNSVGFAAGPELEPSVFANSSVLVESRAAAIGEFPNGAVDITTAIEGKLLEVADIRGIGEVVQAAQDAAAAGLALDLARASGMGIEMRL